jgi:GNAT superfamily N-acetyltransferase
MQERSMIIRPSEYSDTDALCALFDEARGTIAALGIDQWQNGYPNDSVIREDIDRARSFVVCINGEICGTFALIVDGEPTYDKIFDGEWTDPSRDCYFALHRVAVSVKWRGRDISSAIIGYAENEAKRFKKSFLRIDTHKGNTVMRKMLEKHGFLHRGTIFLHSGESRVAYEKRI